MLSISNAMTAAQIRPPLKWAGGKRWLVPHLWPLWEKHEHCRLVEPLCGGLAVTLGLSPQRALLNDTNPHLINFWRWLQRGLVLEIPLENRAECYYGHRQRFNELVATEEHNTKEAAELFYYLNRTGYNGLCRFNRRGFYNVPFGSHKAINYRRDLTNFRDILQGWDFACGDFAHLAVEAADFIYADPPYDVEFTHYTQGGFVWEDQVRLAHWLAQHPGPVVLSNQATGRIRELYSDLGFELRYLKAPRMISCNGDRTPAQEVLAVKGV